MDFSDLLFAQLKSMDILLTCSHYVTQSAQVVTVLFRGGKLFWEIVSPQFISKSHAEVGDHDHDLDHDPGDPWSINHDPGDPTQYHWDWRRPLCAWETFASELPKDHGVRAWGWQRWWLWWWWWWWWWWIGDDGDDGELVMMVTWIFPRGWSWFRSVQRWSQARWRRRGERYSLKSFRS